MFSFFLLPYPFPLFLTFWYVPIFVCFWFSFSFFFHSICLSSWVLIPFVMQNGKLKMNYASNYLTIVTVLNAVYFDFALGSCLCFLLMNYLQNFNISVMFICARSMLVIIKWIQMDFSSYLQFYWINEKIEIKLNIIFIRIYIVAFCVYWFDDSIFFSSSLSFFYYVNNIQTRAISAKTIYIHTYVAFVFCEEENILAIINYCVHVLAF